MGCGRPPPSPTLPQQAINSRNTALIYSRLSIDGNDLPPPHHHTHTFIVYVCVCRSLHSGGVEGQQPAGLRCTCLPRARQQHKLPAWNTGHLQVKQHGYIVGQAFECFRVASYTHAAAPGRRILPVVKATAKAVHQNRLQQNNRQIHWQHALLTAAAAAAAPTAAAVAVAAGSVHTYATFYTAVASP
jgi:hypothetical protein